MIQRKYRLSLSASAAVLLALAGWTNPAHAAPAQRVFTPTAAWLVSPAQSIENRAGGPMEACVMANQFNNGFVVRFAGGEHRIRTMAIDLRQDIFAVGAKVPGRFTTESGLNASIDGSAYKPGIVVFRVRDAEGFYSALQTSPALNLNLGNTDLSFSLSNIRDGLQRLESCLNPPSMPESQSAPAVVPMPITPAPLQEADAAPAPGEKASESMKLEALEVLPPPGQKDMPTDSAVSIARAEGPMTDDEMLAAMAPQEITPAADGSENVSETDEAIEEAVKLIRTGKFSQAEKQKLLEKAMGVQGAPVGQHPNFSLKDREVYIRREKPPKEETMIVESIPPQETARPVMQVWEARKGEDIKIVLARWAERADVDLVWEAEGDGRLSEDIRVNSSFEQAVQALMDRNAETMGLSGHYDSGSAVMPLETVSQATGAGTTAGVADDQDADTPTPAPEVPGKSWTAKKGDDLRMVLSRWAQEEDAQLVWRSDETFTVNRDAEWNGSFEEAVSAILEQYGDDEGAPVGHLNIDPQTQNKILYIEGITYPRT